jgi:hypothetical protein
MRVNCPRADASPSKTGVRHCGNDHSVRVSLRRPPLSERAGNRSENFSFRLLISPAGIL